MKFLSPKQTFLLFLTIVGSSIGTSSVYAELIDKKTVWGQCKVQQADSINYQQRSATNNPIPDAIYLEADSGTVREKGISRLQGNVIIQQNNTQFNSDSASFDRRNNLITANGNVVLSTDNLKFKSNSIKYNLDQHSGTINQAEYEIGKNKNGSTSAQGTSDNIELINEDELRLKQASFSSCPVYNPSWHIQSSDIKINNKTETGTAKNVKLNIKGVPVFYFPKFSFPINNNRRSGFLTPSIRLQSNAGISVPYYFNLAPNYDATVTTSLLQRQGLKFDSEFRYLTKRHQGTIKYDFIPEDKSFDSEFRDYFNIEHKTILTKNTKLTFVAEGVSDKDYFDDLSDSLETSSRSSLKRRLEVEYKKRPWSMSAAIEDFQVIDADDTPYSRLPEFKVGYNPKTPPKSLKLNANVELVNFDKADSITGTRLDAKVTASKTWGDDAWFVKPSLSVQSTLYSLQNTIGAKSLNRSLPTFTLDTGLFFDRQFTSKKTNKKYTQTLEPRLFYSFTPFKDQSDFPVFDTARTDFSATTQLFSENRFTGKDRITDTNKLTFAVSSRIQDRENGKELFSASIGQVYNFDDRKVTLPGGTIATGTRSDLVLELSGRINDNYRVASTLLWDHEEKQLSNYELRLNYQDEKKRIANVSYRKLNTDLNTDELTQLSLSGVIPINDNWSFVGSTDHDIENKRNLETLVGFEYQDCCWKTRLVAKRYLTSDNVNYETPIFIEFELKGLGNLGTNARQELKDKIYGYDDY